MFLGWLLAFGRGYSVIENGQPAVVGAVLGVVVGTGVAVGAGVAVDTGVDVGAGLEVGPAVRAGVAVGAGVESGVALEAAVGAVVAVLVGVEPEVRIGATGGPPEPEHAARAASAASPSSAVLVRNATDTDTRPPRGCQKCSRRRSEYMERPGEETVGESLLFTRRLGRAGPNYFGQSDVKRSLSRSA
jgi:hypothetical protein